MGRKPSGRTTGSRKARWAKPVLFDFAHVRMMNTRPRMNMAREPREKLKLVCAASTSLRHWRECSSVSQIPSVYLLSQANDMPSASSNRPTHDGNLIVHPGKKQSAR